MRITLFLFGITLAALLMAVPANAGTVRGVLRVPPEAGVAAHPVDAYPGHANAMPGMHQTVRGKVTDAVVYVERIPAATDSALIAADTGPPPRFAQRDQTFVPRVLAVGVGTRVEFPNEDPIYHNVFSLSKARRFDLGKYPRGQSRSLVFARAGLVNVYCDIHADMEGFHPGGAESLLRAPGCERLVQASSTARRTLLAPSLAPGLEATDARGGNRRDGRDDGRTGLVTGS